MSYKELAEHLPSLGGKVAEHHEKMEGIPLAKAAQGLQNSVLRFEKKLDDFLEGRGPGIRGLEEMLKSPQAKAHLPLPGLNIISQSLFGEKLKSDKPAEGKRELFERVKKEQAGEKAGKTYFMDEKISKKVRRGRIPERPVILSFTIRDGQTLRPWLKLRIFPWNSGARIFTASGLPSSSPPSA